MEIIINKYCGPKMFGKSVPGSENFALNKIEQNLKSAYTSPWFNSITPGKILTEKPELEDYIKFLTEEVTLQLINYTKYGNYKIKDIWASFLNKRKCCLLPQNFSPPTHKRFLSVKQTKEEFIDDYLTNIDGYLAEPYLAWALNVTMPCPVCKIKGCIALAGMSDSKHSVAFQDAVCTNCLKNGEKTVFEFKLRNKAQNTRIYGGNFTAVSSMIHNKVNLYIVVFERDTGIIIIGKANSVYVKMNEKFLYTIQEKLDWGHPSSIVEFIPISELRAEPPSQMFSKRLCDQIVTEVKKNLF